MRKLLMISLAACAMGSLAACHGRDDPNATVVVPVDNATTSPEPAPCPSADPSRPNDRPPDCP